MRSIHILWPVLGQVLLTVGVYVLLAVRKMRAVKDGKVDRKAAALDNRAWPAEVVKVSNNLANQFEAPVLFYALCFALLALDGGGGIALVLAWLFVASRLVHTTVHVGSNFVPHRFGLFVLGVLILLAMTLVAAWHLLGATGTLG